MRKLTFSTVKPLFIPAIFFACVAACNPETSQDPAENTARDDSREASDDTDPPATDPPATDPPATDPPATDPPATDPPATDPPDADSPCPFPGGATPELADLDCAGADAEKAGCQDAGLVWIKYFDHENKEPYVPLVEGIAVDGRGFTYIEGQQSPDHIVLRLDPEGERVLEKYTFADLSWKKIPYSIAADSDGNFYLAGLRDYKPELSKFDENGQLIWTTESLHESLDYVSPRFLEVRGDTLAVFGATYLQWPRDPDTDEAYAFVTTFSLNGEFIASALANTMSTTRFPYLPTWDGVYYGFTIRNFIRQSFGPSDSTPTVFDPRVNYLTDAATDGCGAQYLHGKKDDKPFLAKYQRDGTVVWDDDIVDYLGQFADITVDDSGKYIAAFGEPTDGTIRVELRTTADGKLLEQHEFDVDRDVSSTNIDFAPDGSLRLAGDKLVARVNLDATRKQGQ